MGLTKPQMNAMRACAESGRLWRNPTNMWRWFRTHPNGMVVQVASNPTIYTLYHTHGMLRLLDNGNACELTDKGAASVSSHNRNADHTDAGTGKAIR